jgi:hypothetical protein
LKLPDEALVYPAHDYKGVTVTTIGEERACNPRLQVKSAQEYVDLMSNLHLTNPKMMDLAIPANMKKGLAQKQIARRGWAYSADETKGLIGNPNVALMDLREKRERELHGIIPCALLLPATTCKRTSQQAGCCVCSLHLGQDAALLLCFRRTLGDGGAGRAGCGAQLRASYACGIDVWKKVVGPLEDGSAGPVHVRLRP